MAERSLESAGFGPPSEKPTAPPTEDEYVQLSRAMWGWTEEQGRAEYRRQVKGAVGG